MKWMWIFLLMALRHSVADRLSDESNLKNIFSKYDMDNITRCGIEGTLDEGLYHCYSCDDDKVKSEKNIERLSISSSDCQMKVPICCMWQPSGMGSRNSIEYSCGVKNTNELRKVNGKMQSRSSVRSVLFGEYPWRTWVFSKEAGKTGNKILCAASIINPIMVMTSARCVDSFNAYELGVTLTRSMEEYIDIKSIHSHDQFKTNTKYVNDISILVMDLKNQKLPQYVSPICLPVDSSTFASSCLTVSEDDNFISSEIVMKNECQFENKYIEAGQKCAVSPPNDFAPEHGAALFCQNKYHHDPNAYMIYGIALDTQKSTTIYTDVFHFNKWIDQIKSDYI